MHTVQVNIISEQTIPNILFIKEFAKQTDKYLFITTEKMNKGGQLDNILSVCQITDQQCYPRVVVNEESLADVETRLEVLQLSRTDLQFIVNITGGTKIMSLGVYSFFSRFNSKMYYMPIGKNEYKQIFPPANEQIQGIEYRISLKDYLKGYGITIQNPDKQNSLVQTPSVSKRLWQHRVTPKAKDSINVRKGIDILKNQAYQERNLLLSSLPSNLADTLRLTLNIISFKPQSPTQLLVEEINYLRGQWLEEYVYTTIKNLFQLGDCFMGNSVKIQKYTTPNELDVVLMRNNVIYVVECKTHLNKEIFDLTAYKLHAIKKEFGLFVKSAIVCLNEYNDQSKRLDTFDIKLLDGKVTRNHDKFIQALQQFIR